MKKFSVTRFVHLICLVLFTLPVYAQQSLDELDRISYKAGPSPLEKQGEPLKARGGSNEQVKMPGTISLSGEWQLVEANGDKPEWSRGVNAKVPGSVHAALFQAGKIPNPVLRVNDTIAEQCSYKSWWMKRKFIYQKNWKSVRLSFDGVANKCTVYLNGVELGSHEGMFGGPDFMVTDKLKNGENELTVLLQAIPNPGKNADPFQSSWNKTVVANCVYGWHYAKIPTIGIWQGVRLEEVPAKAIEHPFVITRNTNGEMRLVVDLPQRVEKGTLKLTVSPKNFKGNSQSYSFNIINRQGELVLDFNIKEPKLWWPNNYGDQNLYTARVSLESGGSVPDVKTVNFGIRTIVMAPQPEGKREDLYNWTFVINGKPIFMKGADWCLIDVMMDLSAEHYRKILEAGKEQHFQLLRAWGGGLSETDTFYDLCDELGLMVMQEWPTCWNTHLSQPLDVMKETVERNTYRIRSHPSLAMWAGGNESSKPFGAMIDMMGKASIEQDGTRAFHRGEPFGGSSHNHDSWWLDLHLNNALNMKALFCGEFGMPSLPVKETVMRYLDGDKFNIDSLDNSVFKHHTPTLGTWGNDLVRMKREASFFLEPNSLDNLILGTQLAQVIGTRRALERSRTRWPESTGALYYKLNDVYPAMAWASVDYYGARKPVHYFVKRSFDPCIPVILFDRTNLTRQEVRLPHFVLDDTLRFKDKQLETRTIVYNSEMDTVYNKSQKIVIKKSVEELEPIALDEKQTCSRMLWFKTDLIGEDGKLINRNWYIENFDSKTGNVLEAPRCNVSVKQTGKILYITNNSTKIPAVGISIEVPGEEDKLILSDSYLWIEPGETVEITMNTSSPARVTGWNADVAK